MPVVLMSPISYPTRMQITDRDVGRNIQVHRYVRGDTQAELANAVGLPRTAISRIESGQRAVAAPELVRLAAALGTSIEELLRAAPTTVSPVQRDRLLMRGSPADVDDQPQLSWFAGIVGALGTDPPPRVDAPSFERADRLPPRQAGELAGAMTRKALNISDEPIESMADLALTLGLLTAGARFPSRSRLAGCLLNEQRNAAALVNLNHPLERQRFTLAHEIGHFLLDSHVHGAACTAGDIRRGPRSAREFRVDVFASALLLPRKLCQRLVQELGPGLAADSLSRRYGASVSATVNRLVGLGLMSKPEGTMLRRLIRGPDAAAPAPIGFRVIGETFASLVRDIGRASGADPRGYVVVPDREVVV